jgi:hypothetical protein
MQGTKARKTPFDRDPDEALEALRDDCIALFLNSKMTQAQVHAAGGPTPPTINRWLYRTTMFPQYRTISSFVEALRHRLVIAKPNTHTATPIVVPAAPKSISQLLPVRANKKLNKLHQQNLRASVRRTNKKTDHG